MIDYADTETIAVDGFEFAEAAARLIRGEIPEALIHLSRALEEAEGGCFRDLADKVAQYYGARK